MKAKPGFEIQADATRNLLHMRFLGHVTAAGLKARHAQVESELATLRPGFTVLTDLSGLEVMDLDCVDQLAKVMDLFRTKGVRTVIRVIPDPNKDIGLKILSIIHLRRAVEVITCATLAEAERALATPDR